MRTPNFTKGIFAFRNHPQQHFRGAGHQGLRLTRQGARKRVPRLRKRRFSVTGSCVTFYIDRNQPQHPRAYAVGAIGASWCRRGVLIRRRVGPRRRAHPPKGAWSAPPGGAPRRGRLGHWRVYNID